MAGLSYEDLIEPTIVKQESKSVAYCRCTRSKNLPFCDGSHEGPTSSRRLSSSRNPKPSPSAAAGNQKTIPIATAPTAAR